MPTVDPARPSPLALRILAACGPGVGDAEVAGRCGCTPAMVCTVRKAHGVPPGLSRREGARRGRAARAARVAAADPGPAVPDELARSLGLSVAVYGYCPPVWFVSDAATGKELGSWVPATGSCRAGRSMHAGLSDPAAVLALFADLVRAGEPAGGA